MRILRFSNRVGIHSTAVVTNGQAQDPAKVLNLYFAVCRMGMEFIGMVMDITDRKRSEEALRRSEKELRDLIENMPGMAWGVLPDGTHQYLSKQWTEYTGLTLTETDHEGWAQAIHPEDVEQHVQKWHVAAAEGRPFENEVRFRRTDGECRWFLVRSTPLRDHAGEITKWHGVLTDIEDRKRAEQALQRSEAALAEERARFAREIHDTLAQGLTGILMQLGAASQIPGNSRQDIATHLNAIQSLARSSLAEARRSVAALRPISGTDHTLAETIDQLIQRVRMQTPADVSFSIRGETIPLQSRVANELSRITQEALNNALKHSGASRISVSLDFQRESAIGISITDNGRGFDTAIKPAPDHFGIEGMQERASSIGASLTIVSELGSGTQVIVQYRRT